MAPLPPELQPLENVLTIRVPTDWAHDGPMTFADRRHVLSGDDRSYAYVGEGDAFGRLTLPGFSSVAQRGLVGKVRMENAVARRVYCTASGYAQDYTTFDLKIDELVVGDWRAAAVITRETILGMHLGPRAGTHMATHFGTKAFGRNVIVAGYPSEDPMYPVDSLQVVYFGKPFDETRRIALFNLLRFLSGARGNSWFIERLDENGQRVSFRYRNFGKAGKTPALQAINLHPVTGTRQIACIMRDFPTMLDRMLDLMKKNVVALEAAIHHYNDGAATNYATSRLRDYSVALEALYEVVTGSKAAPKPSIPKAKFKPRMRKVLRTFDEEFSTIEPRGAVARVRTKVAESNNESPRESMFDAFRSIGIRLRAVERRAIKDYRNGILHGGYHGDESNAKVLRQNAQAGALVVNAFNRVMLKLLQYGGEYLDAYSGEKSYPLSKSPAYDLVKR